MTWRTKLLVLVGVEFQMLSLTFAGALFLPVPSGILSCWIFISCLSLSPRLLLMRMGVALHPVVRSEGGLPKRRKVRVSAWGSCLVPGPLGLWDMVRLVGLFWRCGMLTLVSGPFLLVFWSSFVLSCLVYTGLPLLLTLLMLVLVVFSWWKCFLCMSVGLERGLFWKLQCLSTVVLVVQFLCRLFLRDRALIFGDHSGSWVLCCGLQMVCLGVLEGFCHAIWVLTIAGFGLLVGSNVVMVSRLGLLKLLVLVFCITRPLRLHCWVW